MALERVRRIKASLSYTANWRQSGQHELLSERKKQGDPNPKCINKQKGIKILHMENLRLLVNGVHVLGYKEGTLN